MITRPNVIPLLIGITVLLLLAFQKTGYGDLDSAVAYSPYQVSFVDWVVVYLSTKIATSEGNYFVQVGAKEVNKKVRFVVQVRV